MGKGVSSTRASRIVTLPLLLPAALVIALLLKAFVVQAFFIPSRSMLPTLHKGDRVLVERLGYRLDPPERKDVLVFGSGRPAPALSLGDKAVALVKGLAGGDRTYVIKRVVAVGGDKISYKGRPRVLTVEGRTVNEPYLKERDKTSLTITRGTCGSMGLYVSASACLVPEETVFVMGDNRNHSEDSRVVGPVLLEDVVGRAFLLAWPPANLGGL
ncbi:MAG: signal peptidase I [Actinomycetota bacterium]|nr:signal peptidase I [Actinomycetota bacterium]